MMTMFSDSITTYGEDLNLWHTVIFGGVSDKPQIAELRRGEPSVLARIHEDALLLDVRTLEDDAFVLIAGRLAELDLPAK